MQSKTIWMLSKTDPYQKNKQKQTTKNIKPLNGYIVFKNVHRLTALSFNTKVAIMNLAL